jgi:hypothetical protein
VKHLAIRIAAFFLAFTFAVVVTHVFHQVFIQFKITAMGSMMIEPDGYGGSTAYESYDGVKLCFSEARFPSNEAAEEAFNNILKDAERIIEREPLFDRDGRNVVGERVVAMFPPNDYSKTKWAEVICLDGRNLYQISSPSLRHVLFFDKENRIY